MRTTWLSHEAGLGLFKRFKNLSLLACLAITIQVACSGGGGGGGNPTSPLNQPHITSFAAAQSTLNPGESTTLTALFENGTGTVNPLPAGSVAITNGVPLSVSPQATTTYTLTVTGASGTTAATAITTVSLNAVTSVTVSPGTPTISTGATQQFSATVNGTGSPSQAVTWSASGGSINASGLYTAPGTASTYTVTATSLQDGTKSGSATVTVNAMAPSGLAYSTNPATYTKNVAITANTPSNSGGAAVSYAVNTSLPAGLIFNTGTGVITGTPTAVAASANYTVMATNSGGSTTVLLNITVNEAAVAPNGLTYSSNPATYTKNVAITANTPTSSGGTVVSYAVNPALPGGLILNTGNGVITGTPTAVTAMASYTITATNSGGSTSTLLSVTVNDAAPSGLTYTYTTRRFTTGNAIQSDSPSNGGGAVVSYAVNPALPTGINLNTGTGVITGTPTVVTPQATYTVTATNSGGSAAVGLNFTVVPPGPSISAQPQNTSAMVGAVATFHVTATGTGTLTYQWQKNDVNINVAGTSSNYTTPPLVIGDNGSRYRVLVFDAYGSQDTSTEATLTVTAPASQLRGTNLVGMEMGYADFNQATGPVAGVNYPVHDNRLIDYYASKHVGVLRILFSWEGMQSSLLGTIPASNVGNYKTYFDNYKRIVDYATSKGITVVVEPWQANGGGGVGGAMYRGVLVGTPGVPAAAFADFWSKMATVFAGNPLVSFGLVNEPNTMSTMSWWSSAQAAITAIRGAGSTQWIFVPGNGWTAASSWTSNWYDTAATQRSNAYGWLNANGVGVAISDPLNKTAVEVHTYLDADEAGGTTEITSLTAARDHLAVVINEARAHGYKVFLGEMGFWAGAVANDASPAAAVWSNFIAYFQANSDVMSGYAWWAAGSPGWWDDVAANGGGHFSITPTNGAAFTGDTVNMLMIQANF